MKQKPLHNVVVSPITCQSHHIISLIFVNFQCQQKQKELFCETPVQIWDIRSLD